VLGRPQRAAARDVVDFHRDNPGTALAPLHRVVKLVSLQRPGPAAAIAPHRRDYEPASGNDSIEPCPALREIPRVEEAAGVNGLGSSPPDSHTPNQRSGVFLARKLVS
jgi:hypothetical protein